PLSTTTNTMAPKTTPLLAFCNYCRQPCLEKELDPTDQAETQTFDGCEACAFWCRGCSKNFYFNQADDNWIPLYVLGLGHYCPDCVERCWKCHMRFPSNERIHTDDATICPVCNNAISTKC